MLHLKCLALIATIAFTSSAFSTETGVDSQQIIIGQNITLQGGKNSYGVEVQAGAQLLFKNVNRAGECMAAGLPCARSTTTTSPREPTPTPSY